MHYEHECAVCPMRDRLKPKDRKVKRRLLWHFIKAKVMGRPLNFPCWPRKIAEYRANQGQKVTAQHSPSVATGAQSGVNRPAGGPPLRSGPSGDTGQPVAPQPP